MTEQERLRELLGYVFGDINNVVDYHIAGVIEND